MQQDTAALHLDTAMQRSCFSLYLFPSPWNHSGFVAGSFLIPAWVFVRSRYSFFSFQGLCPTSSLVSSLPQISGPILLLVDVCDKLEVEVEPEDLSLGVLFLGEGLSVFVGLFKLDVSYSFVVLLLPGVLSVAYNVALTCIMRTPALKRRRKRRSHRAISCSTSM